MTMHKTSILFLLLASALHLQAERVSVCTTTDDSAKLMEFTTVSTTKSSVGNVIRLLPDEPIQSIDGFGYALTYSSCYNLMQMSARARHDLLRRTFSQKSGYGVSYTRISIGCSDFSSRVYTLCDQPGIEHFALTSDETDYVIPILKEVLAINPDLKIMASPWTCPRWMKIKSASAPQPYNSWTGGSLNPKYYADYAEYFVRFVQAFAKEGIPIYSITPQNEPLTSGNCASTYMPWEEEAAFIQHLAPAFKRAGITTKIYCFDHNYNYDNKPGQEDYPVKLYNALSGDMEGSELVVGSAWHDYGGTAAELDDIYQQAPGKEIVFTESSIGTWNDGRNLQRRLINDTKNLVLSTVSRQCRAVIVWNMMLDLQRGPNIDGGCQTCYGALDIDESDYRTVTANSHYYMLAHASLAARPGAVRIATQGNISQVSQVAFRNPDGSFGLLLVNESNMTKMVSVCVSTDAFAPITLRARSLTTVVFGRKQKKIPAFAQQLMQEVNDMKYALTTQLEQGQQMDTDLALTQGEGLAETDWYVDPDFFSLTPQGQLVWLPISGNYRIEADLVAHTLTAAPADDSAQSTIYVNAPRRALGKPFYGGSDEWLSHQAMPMAQTEQGIFRFTFVTGHEFNPQHTSFAFFASPAIEDLFVTAQGAPYRLTLDTKASDPFFALGRGTGGHADGHVYQSHFFMRLTPEQAYSAIVDLRQGPAQGILRIARADQLPSAISHPHTDKATAPAYDLQGRPLPHPAPRGISVEQGRKVLKM